MTNHPARLRRIHGLGLVEIMIALVVVGVIAAIAVPSMTSFIERRRIVAVADEVASVIRYAQIEAKTNGAGTRLLLQDDPSNTMSCAAVVNLNSALGCKCYEASCIGSSETMLRNFQLYRNSTTVRFSATAPDWAMVPQTIAFGHADKVVDIKGVVVEVVGTVTGAKLRVAIQDTGLIKICSVSGKLGGHATCS